MELTTTRLIGNVGKDWIRKQRFSGAIGDDLLRGWRDHLEDRLSNELSVVADLGIGDVTHFRFHGKNEIHTITEIEAFARRDLDLFLNKRS